ncbi:MAG TPA: hypothetical protein ENI33_05125 [Thermoplasmatales archaeon]|nr:hypothetical protein [Thermoplasmatales archaeon]
MKIKKFIVILIAFILLPVVINESKFTNNADTIKTECGVERRDAIPVIASKENPFYALIATPVALFYDNEMHVEPLLIKNISNPSSSIKRFEEIYDLSDAIVIESGNVADVSSQIALEVWERSDEAIIIKNDFEGYELGVSLSNLACYKGIPIFVADEIGEIISVLQSLKVKKTYVCGDIEGYGTVVKFRTIDEIVDYMIYFLKQKFGKIDYILMSNPMDIVKPSVIETTEYEFEGTASSVAILPAQSFHAVLTQKFTNTHEFEIPPYKHARVKVDLINLDSENVLELGDGIFFMVMSPDGNPYVYTATGAGIPVYDENGDIIEDRVHYEFIISDEPGIYSATIIGRWFANVEGRYRLNIEIEEIDMPLDPLMECLSSLSGYLSAFHKGLILSKSEFAYAGSHGMSQPGDNPALRKECNEHVWKIHQELNEILSKISDLPYDEYNLWEYYRENPLNIAILADTTMIPMYYYKNPDDGYIMGWGVPGDFIYGDVDPDPQDTENDTFTYYPFQENAVGRITGYDAEDCSALIARTIFYNEIIKKLGEWKQNATVQTGCGLEFQWIPLLTTISNLLLGSNEPTKWPSGESFFINLRLCNDLTEGGYNVKRTHLVSSQREGFENLAQYGRRYFLFPHFYEKISGENVKGGKYQQESNIIFTFNHGFYYLYESGDILLDARGFPPFTTISRFYPMGSGLSSKGTYDVRNVYNMEFGPSVVYIESCIVGRTDGLSPENCLSQAYLHSGVNTFIAASRVTADPGYLEPGLIFEGFGAWGLINATINLKTKGEYPHPHFGAVIAEDFILDLINNDSTTGMALRNAKNKYLQKDANSTFLWTPPLISTGCFLIDREIYKLISPRFEYGKYLDKKYHCLHEFNLYGDPAFNPWNP